MKIRYAGAFALLLGAVQVRADMVRVYLEYIDVPHALMTSVMSGVPAEPAPALHGRMRELVKEKKARIHESVILVLSNGQKAIIESIRENIYPTEEEPGGLGSGTGLGTDAAGGLGNGIFPLLLRPGTGSAFETRNTGVTLEVAPLIKEGGKLIDLRLAPEIVNPLRLEEWMKHKDEWGDASVRFPIFESLRLSTGITLMDGKFGFLGVLTPTDPKGGLVTERKLMLFVRADILFTAVPARKEE